MAATSAAAQKRYDPGASDTEIRVGQTMPSSGPLSMLGTIGKATAADFEKVNAEGGINGRRLRLISLDDGYTSSKTVEGTRRLVEDDEVLLVFGTVGTATNLAIHRYLNTRKVPQLLILSGANRWNDPRHFPYTVSGMLSHQAEARMYARRMLATVKAPKIAVLHQDDDFGRDFVAGPKAQLGERARSLIVAEASYEVTDPTVDSQMVMLKSSGANVFFAFSNGKFTVQSLRRLGELGWAPQLYLPASATSIASILKPAGAERAVGAVTTASMKNPIDPQGRDDAGIQAHCGFMKRWAPALDPEDSLNVTAHPMSMMLAGVLRRCGNDLTRDSVMRQLLSLRDYSTPVMLPGVSITTAPDDFEIYGAMRLQRFDGRSWVPFGEPMQR